MRHPRLFTTATALGLLAAGGFSTAHADHHERSGTGNAANGILDVSADVPQEVRVGQQMTFDITVTNVSDDVELRDVQLEANSPGQLVIESAKISGQQNQNRQQGQNRQQNQNRQQGQDRQQGQNRQSNDGSGAGMMTIDSIGPGETRTISVTASAEKEGDINACLLVTSYTPAICLRTSAVKPELEITKTAPETARLCEPIVVKYTVRNSGSADLQNLTIEDQLPQGLMTVDGEKTFSYPVEGGLKAGDARAFEVTLRASEPGEFTSRAVAKAKGMELKDRSQQTTTTVEAARLDVALDGPNEVYLGQPVTYTIRVTNNGNVDALDTRVAFEYPTNAQLARAGEPSDSDRAVQSSREDDGRQPNRAMNGNRQGRDRGQANNNRPSDRRTSKMPQMDVASRTFELGDLAAGQTREMSVTLQPTEGDAVRPVAIAQALCDLDQDESASRLVSTAYARTGIVTLPAMLLECYDNEQDRTYDGKFTYTVRIYNQGDAADNNVKLTAQMPEGLTFVSADGPTDVTADGQKLTFDTIDTFEPGQQEVWKIQTKSKDGAEGDVRFKVELNTEAMDSPATAEEPTRLLGQN